MTADSTLHAERISQGLGNEDSMKATSIDPLRNACGGIALIIHACGIFCGFMAYCLQGILV
jgi:hypothetical protein